MNYWAGAQGHAGKCGCWTSRSCPVNMIGQMMGCNCDVIDFSWKADGGYITDMSLLPITGLSLGYFNDTDKEGYHTIGPLVCTNSM